MEPIETPEEDVELIVHRAITGDSKAFATLAEIYRPGVRRAVRKVLACTDSCDDVEQEVFLLAWRALPRLREPEKFAGWLLAIAKRQAIHAAQRLTVQRRQRVDNEILGSLTADSPEPESDWLSARVQALPDDLRSATVLHYLEGWPVSKIAADFSLPVTTVKWRLHRARQLLRQWVGDC